ncbi:MAG: hypothetical protein PHS34_07610 [Candidatus Omnitrophica bacterium]|nr:hypothetical protein [Candidatus Omnitrophota bacterium]MDD5551108.1 hypothetical protein [Candidatus Omnitrophota bacterium]
MEKTKTPILDLITKELTEFTQPIKILDSWEFSQKDTIEQAILYTNSKFVDGDIDELNFKRYFYNITKYSCGATTKAIDVDTKDIMFLTSAGGNPLKTWFIERDIKNWMKVKNFGSILNKICRDLPIYGSVVLKAIKGNCYFVDLRNFVCEQNADSLDYSNYIIEQNYYTPSEFKKTGNKNGWDKDEMDKMLKLFASSKEQYIRVFERYGEVENEDGLSDYKMVIVADIPQDVKNNPNVKYTITNDILLADKLVPRHPYFEIHINKISGRWLGVGVPEQVSENQIRINEVSNEQVRSSKWSTLRLFWSRDPGQNRNLLTSAEDGEVLQSEDEIKQVDMVDRNLAYYQEETAKWEGNAQRTTFTTDIMLGERTPAGTPLGSAQLSTAQAMSYFDQMREDLGLALKVFLFDYIIPQAEKNLSKEHILRIAGEDLEQLNELILNTNIHKKFFEYVENQTKNRGVSKLPSPEFMELLKTVEEERISRQKEQQMFVPTDWYKDAKYEIEIEITGESKDARIVSANLFAALQAMGTDPTLLQDPIKRKVFGKYLELGGININDFSVTKQEIPTAPTKGAGGGVSAQTNIGGPQMTNINQTI